MDEEFPERIEYADLDDEDLVESMEQIKGLMQTFLKGGDAKLAEGLQGSIDRMAKELEGRKERYEALEGPEAS